MKPLTLIAAVLTSCTPAHAAPFIPPDCMSLTAASEESRTERGEVKQWLGLSDDSGEMLMIFASPEGSWTMVRTDGDIACLVDFGSSEFTDLPQPPERDYRTGEIIRGVE